MNLLLFFAEAEAWCVLLDHQARDTSRSFPSGPHHHNIHVCVSATADEGLKNKPDLDPDPEGTCIHKSEELWNDLWPVQYVMVALRLRACQERGGVAAAAWNHGAHGSRHDHCLENSRQQRTETDLVRWDNRRQTFPWSRDQDRISPSARHFQKCQSSRRTCCRNRQKQSSNALQAYPRANVAKLVVVTRHTRGSYLWMLMYAVVLTHPVDKASKITDVSRRERPDPPTSGWT